jgi:DNA modification methylase
MQLLTPDIWPYRRYGTQETMTGDCRDIMPTFRPKSFQMACTSPPYYRQRDYDTAQWEGGDHTCDHRILPDASPKTTRSRRAYQQGHVLTNCRCGARLTDRQIGIEETPAEYVANIVKVFRLVRPLLKPDGTVWLNLGDTYSAGGRGGHGAKQSTNRGTINLGPLHVDGLKAKQLLGIPWRCALALQDDGWWLRSAITIVKLNPMPESVGDRPTSAYENLFLMSDGPDGRYDPDAVATPDHELLFLLSRAKSYTYDREAIREPATGRTDPITGFGDVPCRRDRGRWFAKDGLKGANARNVWFSVATPFKGGHFATMPLDVAERCIRAGSRPNDLVLDPFAGVFTTGVACQNLGRRSLLIELNSNYVTMGEKRMRNNLPEWVQMNAG